MPASRVAVYQSNRYSHIKYYMMMQIRDDGTLISNGDTKQLHNKDDHWLGDSGPNYWVNENAQTQPIFELGKCSLHENGSEFSPEIDW